MTPTISWLLNQKINNSAEFTLLAGGDATDSVISGVNIMDNPDTVPWLKENELILSTGYIFTSTSIYKTIIKDLKEKGCCGLGIKMHRYMESVPVEMLQQANELNFPIFSIPFSTTMEQIINLIYFESFKEEMSETEKTMLFFQDIMSTSLKHHNALHVLKKIAISLETSVFMTDSNFQLMEYHYFEASENASGHPYITQNNFVFPETDCLYLKEKQIFDSPITEHEVQIQNISYQFSIFPIKLRKNLLGYFICLNTEKKFALEQYNLIENIQSILSITYIRHQMAAESKSFSKTSFYQQILSGAITNSYDAEKLCSQYGFDYFSDRICFVLQSKKYHTLSMFQQKSYTNQIMEPIFSIADENMFTVNYTVYNHDLVCFLSSKNFHSRFLTQIITELSEKILYGDNELLIGFSRIYKGAETIYVNYQEARSAIDLGIKVHPKQHVFSYQEDIIYHTLSKNMTTSALYECYNSTLKPLCDYDTANGTDLYRTLRYYLICDHNTSKAAKELYIHRNTMIHRMEQIAEIINLDIKNPDHIYQLQTAFYIKKLLPDEKNISELVK